MADMSAPALLESPSGHIFNLSLRRRTAPSSRGPASPDTGQDRILLPRSGPNGRRRFLLPRPAATTFIRLHLRMEPLFLARAPAPCFLHGSPSESAFVGLDACPHNGLTRLRPPSSSSGRLSTVVCFGRRPEGLAHPLERGLSHSRKGQNRCEWKICRTSCSIFLTLRQR